MEIKVTFRFDATEGFLVCIDNFRKAAEAIASSGIIETLPAKDAGVVKAVATEDGVTMKKKEQVWPPVGQQESPVAASESAAGQPSQPATEEQPAAAEEAPGASTPTVEDMRAAVARCRERIEGAGWEDKTSDGYKLYHKKVTAAVKGILGFCGTDKIPSVAEDKRQVFINSVDNLVLVDGEVQSEQPF